MLDANGEALAEAASAWLVMDPEARRLVRHPKTRLDWRSTRGRAWPEAFHERPRAVEGVANERALAVRRADIDVNGHVNHVHFVTWAMEAVPESRWRDAQLRSFEIEYLAEAMPGEEVLARAAPEPEGTRWRHEVIRASDGRALVRARSDWSATKLR